MNSSRSLSSILRTSRIPLFSQRSSNTRVIRRFSSAPYDPNHDPRGSVGLPKEENMFEFKLFTVLGISTLLIYGALFPEDISESVIKGQFVDKKKKSEHEDHESDHHEH